MKSSRFDLDKRISDNILKKIRSNWISSYFSNIKNKTIFSVKIRNKLIGLLCIKKEKENIIIDLITLKKNFSGKGIGKKMINFLEFKFANYKNILVGTYRENKKQIFFTKTTDLKNINPMKFIIIMKNSLISENKTFIIAEIGNNHEGNYILAKKMIVAANKAGADAVKLQHIVPEKFFFKKRTNKKIQKISAKGF